MSIPRTTDMSTRYITNENLYKEVIATLAGVREFVWIGTADIKDMHVETGGGVKPFLALLDGLVRKGVEVRLLHAKDPGPQWRSSFDKYPMLWKRMERQLCPRVHFKLIVADGKWAYSGSANLTGAGLGMKAATTRNFESGIHTTDPVLVEQIMDQFDSVWMGSHCKACKRRDFCGDPIV